MEIKAFSLLLGSLALPGLGLGLLLLLIYFHLFIWWLTILILTMVNCGKVGEDGK